MARVIKKIKKVWRKKQWNQQLERVAFQLPGTEILGKHGKTSGTWPILSTTLVIV